MIEIINFINMNGETNVKLIRDKILKEYNIKLKNREVSRLIDIVNKFNENSEFISLDQFSVHSYNVKKKSINRVLIYSQKIYNKTKKPLLFMFYH